MKIALCFYGQPRFIDNPRILETFKDKVYSQGEVDVYTHFWFDEKMEKFNGSPVSTINFDLYVLKDTLKIIDEKYKPYKQIVEPPKNFDVTSYISKESLEHFKLFTYYSEGLANVGLSQFYSYEKVVKLLQKTIEEENKEYDFVVISRFDAFLNRFPNLSELEKGIVYYTDYYCLGCWTDIVIICDPSSLPFLHTYTDFEKIINTTVQYSAAPDALRKNGILMYLPIYKVRQTDLYAAIVRGKDDKIGES